MKADLCNKKTTNYKLVALSSFLIVSIAIIPVLVMHKGNLYLVGDYISQQIPFIKECRRVILSGTPFWSANTFLGANFIGTYSFYTYTTPFFWPLLFVPEKYIGMGIGVMFVFKHVVAALTAHLYLSKHTKNVNFAIIGSLMYAFSSFTMDSSFYYHFIDVIAFFPLVLYFADEVLENRNKTLLALTALLCAVVNYYFFIATSIIFLIYLFFRIKFSEKYKWVDGFRSVFFYGIGAVASAVILLPSALCVLETTKATMSYTNKLATVFATIPQAIKLIEGIILPSEGILGSSSGFIYSQFGSNAAFIPFFGALFLFVALRKKEKQWDYKMMKFLFILTFVPLGNGLFSLFSNMVYTRWWYGFVLISIVISIHVLEDAEDSPLKAKEEYRKSAKLITILSSIVLFAPVVIKLISVYLISDIILKYFPKAFLGTLKSSQLIAPFTTTDLRYAISLAFLIVISYLSLYLAIKHKWIYSKKVVPVVAVICLLTYCTYLTGECITYGKLYPQNYIEEAEPAVQEGTTYTSRVQNSKALANYSMISNEPGIDTFHSIKSKSTSEFCRIVGYEIGTMPTTRKFFNTSAIHAVLSVSEVVNKDSTRQDSPYYIPMGFVYEYYVEDVNYEFSKDIEENNRRIQLMTQACFLDSETAKALGHVVKPLGDNTIDWVDACELRRQSACTDFVLTSKGFSATSQGDKERLVFFSIPNDNGWTAYVNGEETEIYTVNGGLIGIVVPEGTSNITFNFMPPGLIAGAIISSVMLVGIIAYGIFEFLKRKKGN